MSRAMLAPFVFVTFVACVAIGCSSSSSSSSGDGGAACSDAECGGPPPAHCSDGSTPIYTCARNVQGTCGWSIDCPPADSASDTNTDTNDGATTDTTLDADAE